MAQTTTMHRVRSSDSMRSKSFSSLSEINPLEKATSLAEAAEKLAQSKKIDDALLMYEGAIEEILENSKYEIDLDTLIKYHFTVGNYAKRMLMITKQRENRELDLTEILNSSPQQQPFGNVVFTKESLDSEVFLFKVQLKMKMTAELKKTRTYKSKQYPNTFSGTDAVLWMLNNGVVSNNEDAINIGQAMVDTCLISHVEEDQPFVEGSRLYRFVDRELYYLQLAMKNPNGGLPTLQQLEAQSASLRKAQKQKRFSGREISDWLEKKDVLRLVERSEANRLAQRLVENYHLKNADNPIDTIFQDSDEVFFAFTRESKSVSSLHTATQKGFLSFTTDGSKWKTRFFVLVPAEKLLYYFEAEDSPKPKGILNLNAISLLQLDETMFNKKYCFQTISPTEGTISFAPQNEELRDQWVNSLAPLTIESTSLREEETRQLSSFNIFIEEAQDLTPDKSYFCVIFYGAITGAPIAKTQVQWKCKNGVSTWSESFQIYDLPFNVNEITVGVYSQKSSGDRSLVGFVSIKLNTLSSYVEQYNWFPLSSGSGKLRLKFSLEEELILPLKAYTALLDFSTQNFDIPRTLLNLTSALDRQHFAQTVLKILEAKGCALDFLTTLIRADVEATSEAAVLFRVNTVGTKAVVEYMKMVAQSYISSVLHSPLQSIIRNGVKFEESSNLTPEVRAELQTVLGSIFSSVNHMPIQLKRLLHEIRKICVEKFPSDSNIGNLSVSAFLFLRFLCPALVAPAAFGVLDEVPDSDSARVFKSLARLVQYLANLKLDHSQQNDAAMKECLEENTPKMKAFLESASDPSAEGHSEEIAGSVDLERELAYFYHNLVNQNSEMADKISQTTRDSLSSIMDDISTKYEEKWSSRSSPYQYKPAVAKPAMVLS